MTSPTTYLYSIIKVIYAKMFTFTDHYDSLIGVERQYPRPSIKDAIYSIFENPSHIIDNIYLGNAYNAANYEILKEMDIDCIINITNNIPNYYEDYFEYITYRIKDNNHHSIKEFLIDSFNFINRNKNKKILVHCYAGSSRSASIVLYYLIKNYNMTFDDANTFLKEKRSIVNINTTFIKDIKELTT